MTDQIHDDRAAAYVQARELLTAAGDGWRSAAPVLRKAGCS